MKSSHKNYYITADILYAIASLKGGVGKTTDSASIAYYLSEVLGKKVAFIDMDVTNPTVAKVMNMQGSMLEFTKEGMIAPIKYSENLKVMSVDFLLPRSDQPILLSEKQKRRLIVQLLKSVDYGKCDYVIFDTPPTTSPEYMTILKLMPKKKLCMILVTQPGEASSNSVQKSIMHLKNTGISINGIICNMDGFTCPGCGRFDHIFPNPVSISDLADNYEIPFLGSIELGGIKATDKGAMILQSKSFKTVMNNILTTKPVKFKPIKKKLTLLKKLRMVSKIEKNLAKKTKGRS